jgi:hypothetical protein
VLGAFGIEVALEELGDLLKRKWLSLMTGRDRIAFYGPETLSGIDVDEPLFGGEVENIL